MEWLLLALLGGGGAFAARRLSGRRTANRERLAELESVRRLAEEDVTVLGEQLQGLDAEVTGHDLESAGRDDYQRALDAYEKGKWSAPRLREPDEISVLMDTLAEGRYAMACVRARLAGRELPELRVPCFFNPQHGPSASDVMWTSTRHGSRRVPACVQCSTRVKAREKPEVRTVTIGTRRVPYWEAGAAYLPYSQGYFPAEAAAAGAGIGWLWVSPALDAGGHGGGHDLDHTSHGDFGGDFGWGGGMDGGGGDAGGF